MMGWERGRIRGLDVKVRFTEGDRDFLVDNRINPIRYKEGSGLVIWGKLYCSTIMKMVVKNFSNCWNILRVHALQRNL
jgi:hypothetical protein